MLLLLRILRPDIRSSVVLLRDVEELTAEEAAEVLEISPDSVKSRLHRGRLALRPEMVDI
jgi:RNA polymerase sigma-70 factor (ECF subfamily)